MTKWLNYKPRNATYLNPIENTNRFKSYFIDRPIFDKDIFRSVTSISFKFGDSPFLRGLNQLFAITTFFLELGAWDMYLYGNFNSFKASFRLNLKWLHTNLLTNQTKTNERESDEFHWFIKQTQTVSCIRRSRIIAKKFYSLKWKTEPGLPIEQKKDAILFPFITIYEFSLVGK